jgi:hypothetical protein
LESGEWSTVKIAMMEDNLSPSVMTSGQVEMEFRDILSKLLDSRFDQFEILNLARKFSIQLPQDMSLSKQTLVIQKFVLEQLLKSGQSEYYTRLLNETEGHLQLRKRNIFVCCLVGCLFSTELHKKYLKHLKSVHSNHNRLVCNYKKICKRQFSTFSLLLDHVADIHVKKNPSGSRNPHSITEAIACKCDLLSCGRNFREVGLLMSHLNTDHNAEQRYCIFEGCSQRFTPGYNSRRHFLEKHKKTGNLQLKREHLLNRNTARIVNVDLGVSDSVLDGSDEENEYDDGIDLRLEIEAAVEDDESLEDDSRRKDYFLKQYSDFLNRLCHFHFIPVKTVTKIADEYLQNSLKASSVRELKLRKSLKSLSNITESQIDTIVKESILDDDYLNAQRELSSAFLRNKYVKENFQYVPPQEHVLNPEEVKNGASKDVIHYVDVKDSFKTLVEDKSFLGVIENNKNRVRVSDTTEVLRDLCDGSAHKDNSFFRNNPGAFAAHFYSDAVELSNPLGWAKGRHKIIQVFYSIAQVPRSQRSQIDRMQLALVCKEKLIKKYGYEVIFSKLVQDLKVLEGGITINFPVRREVQLGLLVYSSDNLEAHTLGGFSCCFSSKDICRFCHCTHSELSTNIHDFDGDVMKKYWTVPEYDSICDDLEKGEDKNTQVEERLVLADNLFFDEENSNEDSEDENEYESGSDEESEMNDEDDDEERAQYGLRFRCPLNQLEAFHAVVGFPPDCMHDLLEGVVAQDLLAGIRILIKKSWFTLEQYNLSMKNLQYFSYEASDKPQDVPKKGRKLSGKACSLWVHIRNFPLIVRNLVEDEEDEILSFLLLLVDITARITASEFRHHEIHALEERVIKYLDERKRLFVSYKDLLGTAKPKHHFLIHYGQAIRLYGPPLVFWTGRFESKHRVAKNIAESAKNFKNISWTVSERQQMRMASIFYEGMYSNCQFVVPEQASYKKDLNLKTPFLVKLNEFMTRDDHICSDIQVDGIKYQTGALLVTEVLDGGDSLKVGLLKIVLIKDGKVFFVVKQFVAEKKHLGYYESKHVDTEFLFRNADTLADSKPLIMRGTETKFQFVLHHHISFDFS